MKKGARLLALDLDGTILNRRRAFSPATLDLLRRLRREGNCTVCFVTGRREVDMEYLGEDGRISHYSILNSGAQILDNTGEEGAGRTLLETLVDPAEACALIRFCLEHRVLLNVCGADYWGVNYTDGPTLEYARQIRRQPVLYHSLEEVPWRSLQGFTATQGGDMAADYIRRNRRNLYCVPSEPGCFDITPGGVGKGSSLRLLADKLGISRENIIAAGNYHNDLDMLKEAGVAVAVANALPAVKAAADYVTARDNDHDALVEIAERFQLLGGTVTEPTEQQETTGRGGGYG